MTRPGSERPAATSCRCRLRAAKILEQIVKGVVEKWITKKWTMKKWTMKKRTMEKLTVEKLKKLIHKHLNESFTKTFF